MHDSAFVLNAGEIKYWQNLNSGLYTFEIETNDGGLNIMTFPTNKDDQLYVAGAVYEGYQGCAATDSLRFNVQCRVDQGAVFMVHNKNILTPLQVSVKITRMP